MCMYVFRKESKHMMSIELDYQHEEQITTSKTHIHTKLTSQASKGDEVDHKVTGTADTAKTRTFRNHLIEPSKHTGTMITFEMC